MKSIFAAVILCVLTFFLALVLFVPAAPIQEKPLPAWGDVREVEIDGCQYLVWIYHADGFSHSGFIHKGNCTNHGVFKLVPPKDKENKYVL